MPELRDKPPGTPPYESASLRTLQEAFYMIAANLATGVKIQGEDHIRPVAWYESSGGFCGREV